MTCTLLDSAWTLIDPTTDRYWRIADIGDPPVPVATPTADRSLASWFRSEDAALDRMIEASVRPAEIVRVDR